MTPEMQLAKLLSPEPTAHEKLASAFDDMSIEELEQVLRDEGVDRATGSDDRLETLVQWADSQGREMARLEKTALVDQALGGVLGHHYGKEQKKRGEDYNFGVPQGAAALLLPGGAGYQIGRYIAHNDHNIKKGKKSKTKKASIEKLALPAMAALAAGAKKAVGTVAGKALTTGTAGRAAVGAGVGAVGGALKNPGEGGSRLTNMAVGAGLGAGAGVGAKAGVQRLGSMNNAAGRYVGGATKAVAKQTGNQAALGAARGMQVNRMGAQSAVAKTRQVAKGPVVQPPGARPMTPQQANVGMGRNPHYQNPFQGKT
jgi:hypothetical protein